MYFGCTDLISGWSLFVRCLFRCSELTPSDKHWPDLKQPLRPRWDEAATENGVRSNQRCCHDYVQFTPTCNQATGSACHKADVTVAGRLNAERLDRKLGAAGAARGVGGVGEGKCSLVLSDQSRSQDLARRAPISCCTRQRCVYSKQMHQPLSCFVLVAKRNASTLSPTGIKKNKKINKRGQEIVLISYH